MANKILFNGKEILDIDSVKDKYTQAQVDTKLDEKVSSDTVNEIRIVTEYPAQEETGVLYIKVESNN